MERLHRSKKNKVIFGVCGGLSEYLHIDVTLIRIVCILAMSAGAGIVLYIVAALIMPEDSGYSNDSSQWGTGTAGANYSTDFESEFTTSGEWDRPANHNPEKRFIIGIVLLGLGILILGKQFLPGLFNLKILVPLLLIIIGGVFVLRKRW